MDESEWQLLHELRHATASSLFEMISGHVSTRSQSPLSPSVNQFTSPEQEQVMSFSPMEGLRSSLISGKFSDLTIVHGAQEWRAHKVIVCSQSSILEGMVLKLQDPAVLDLTEHDHDAVSSMIEYLYTSAYTTSPEEPEFCLPLHIKVYVLASALGIVGLQTLSCSYFALNLNSRVTDLGVYFSSVKDIYACTSQANPGLRVAVVEAAVSEMRRVLAEDEVWKRFNQVLHEVPDFQKDLMSMLVEYPDRPVQVIMQELCEDCGPRGEDDSYVIPEICKGCGVLEKIEFC